MDVRCERCNTEYEFDDALVSGRGTTVKCTNCGHKFKIRRGKGDFSEDFWNVGTTDGKTLVFTSLRELQRAIQTHLVGRSDTLSRGGLPPKAIGQIPELAPFFDPSRTSGPPPPPRVETPRQPHGSSGRMPSRPPPPPPGASPQALTPPPPAPRARMSTRPDFPPAPGAFGKSTLIGTGSRDDAGANAARAAKAPSTSNAPVAAPAPAPPAMRKRMSSVPPPITEREPEPDTARFERESSANEPPAPPPGASKWGPSGTMPPASYATGSAPPPVARTDDAFAYDPRSAPPDAYRSAPPQNEIVNLPKQTPVLAIEASGMYPAANFATPPPPPPAVATPPPPPNAMYEPSSPLPPPTAPMRRLGDYEDFSSEPPIRGRPSYPDAPSSMGKRRSVGGFVVVSVLLASAALLGVVWAKDNLGARLGLSKPPPAATVDPRAAAFLTTGEKALADGNVDLARESFDKASALAEKDPHVLLDLARLAATRADTLWLKSRLLASDASDEHRVVRDGLAELATAARKSADDALALAPDDPAALRAKIDALRISGDRDGARALVAKITSSASQPESAYVLAALDLAESEPLWSTVLERLRLAAGAESGPGRARAALVYALARSGDLAGAKSELDRLEAMPRRHELVPALKAFVDRAKSAPAVRDAGAPVPVSALADKPEPGERRPPGGGGFGGGDPRRLVAAAEAARGRGDLEKAQTLYSAALDKNPADTEALNGLAAIAQARGDLNGAKASYKRVLSINPSYVPALVGLADVEWASGDRGGAMKIYREIVDRFPEGTYPPRVKQRVEGGSAPAPTATATSTSTSTATTPPQKDEPGF